VHAVPWLEQEPLPHTAPLQVSVPQHCDEVEHDPPVSTQPLSPVQVPPEQVKEPQHWELLEHRVPALWQEPELQTLFALHSKVPQQSPLVLQVWLLFWQGPV
jgi:hypothetical protein